jgi:hypothetical protein
MLETEVAIVFVKFAYSFLVGGCDAVRVLDLERF